MMENTGIMDVRRRSGGREREWGAAVVITGLCLVVALVIGAAERGLFAPFSPAASRIALPGITLDDDDDDGGGQEPMPVVTSLRSDSEAERLGVRVGDHIAAVNGRRIRDVASLRAIVTADQAHGPVALHILRGSAVWNVAIDRTEPPASVDRIALSGR